MTPELSVVIATHDRSELLARCIEALRGQTQDPGTFELIVADDGSTDGTAEFAAALRTPFALKVLRLPKGSKSIASNAAIEAARAPVCLFLDDDVIPSPGLVAEHLAAHRRDPKALGLGRLTQKPPGARDWYADAYADAWNRRYDELESRTPRWSDCYGGNFSAPREALVEVGGFSTEIPATVDIELGFRLCRAGCRPVYLAEADAIHDDGKRRKRIIEHTLRHGRLTAGFVEDHPEMEGELLGWFLKTTPREVALRRLTLALRVPPNALAVAVGALPWRAWRSLWFGFIARYAVWLGVRSAVGRARWLRITRGTPVLMYHAFAERRREADRFVIPKRSFARQMRLLALLRYRVVTLERLAESLRGEAELPPRATVITIDDGYRDNLEIAAPILRRRGFPATVFLVSGRIGASNDWSEEPGVGGRPLLTDKQLSAMDGVLFGAHTRSHLSLPEAPEAAVAEEVGAAREELESSLGQPVETFAYPYGRHDERAVGAVAAAGYSAACSTEGWLAGPGDDPLSIPRLEIRGSDSILRFLRKLWLGDA